MWLLTYASMPRAMHMMAALPAHMPSIPSFRFEPLLTAITMKVVRRTKKIQPAAVRYLPRKRKMSA